MTSWLENPKLVTRLNNNKLICVRISVGSLLYMQFAGIYQLVPVPSIFFLSNDGMPIEILTSIIPSIDELENKIINIQTKYEQEQSMRRANVQASEAADLATTTTATTSSDTTNAPNKPAANMVDSKDLTNNTEENPRLVAGSEDDASKKLPPSFESDKTKLNNDNDNDINEMSTSKEVSKVSPEQKSTVLPNNEKNLNKDGRTENQLKDTAEKSNRLPLNDERQVLEEYNKKVLSEIRREKLEAKAARDQIRAQIAADKLERAKKFAQIEKEYLENVNKNDQQQQSINRDHNAIANQVILQFRFGEGETLTQNFEFNTQLSVIRQFVRDAIMKNSMEFKLATTYPMREFTTDEDNMTLEELRLTPTAVIMVISKKRMSVGNIMAKPNAIFSVLRNLLWVVLNPVLNGVVSIKDWLMGHGAVGQLPPPRTLNITS